MKSFIFGQTSQQLPIMGYRFGNNGPKVLIIAGVHGDEHEGIIAAQNLLQRFAHSFTYKLQLTLVPMFNLDGVLIKQRKNANQIDLNRNLPTNDWTESFSEEKYSPGTEANSEPENQALVKWLSNNKPQMVFSLHSWKPMLNINGNCRPEAELICKLTGYEITKSVGYPTPGCLGTYCGLERDMPTITYELQRNMPTTEIIQQHTPALLESLKVTEERF